MKVSLSISSFDKTFIARTIFFLLLLSSIIVLTGYLFEFLFKPEVQIKWSEEKKNIDILILGSSQAEAAYNRELISKLTGQNCFNAAAKGQQPDSTYYVLKDILKEHAPHLVILDVYWRTLDGNVDLSQLIRSYESIKSEEIKREFIKEGFSLTSRFEYALPILRYRQNFHTFLERGIQDIIDGKRPFLHRETSLIEDISVPLSENDNVIAKKNILQENKFRYTSPVDFNEQEMLYLTKIVQLCKSNGLTLIVCAAPILPESLSFVPDYDDINLTLTRLFGEQGYEYNDYNLRNINGEILDFHFFKDENHMNRLGAEKFSLFLYENLIKQNI